MSSGEDLARWDHVADVYARSVGGDGDSFYRRFAPFLWPELGDIQGLRVLDLGCGHGWRTVKLHEAGADVVGVDGSSALITTARGTYPDLEFQIHDLAGGLPSSPEPVRYHRIVSHMDRVLRWPHPLPPAPVLVYRPVGRPRPRGLSTPRTTDSAQPHSCGR